MSITFQCQDCGARYKTGEENVGRKTKCKNCEAVVVIQPAGEAAPANPQRPKTRTLDTGDLAPKTGVVAKPGAERAKTQVGHATRPMSQPGVRPASKPMTKSVASAAAETAPLRPATKSISRPDSKAVQRPASRPATKSLQAQAPKPKISPMARLKARHKDVSKDALAKLSEAGNIGVVSINRDKIKQAGEHHENFIDKVKKEKSSKTKTIIIASVFLVVIAVGAYLIVMGTTGDQDKAKRMQEAEQALKGKAFDGGEWWCNNWADALPDQTATYQRLNNKGEVMTTEAWLVLERDEAGKKVKSQWSITPKGEDKATVSTVMESFDPVTAKARMLGAENDFKVVTILDGQTLKVGDKELVCTKIEKIIGMPNDVKRKDILWLSQDAPVGHVVRLETHKKNVVDKEGVKLVLESVLVLQSFGGPEVDKSKLSVPAGKPNEPQPADGAGDAMSEEPSGDGGDTPPAEDTTEAGE